MADLSHATVYVSWVAQDARYAEELLRELTRTLALDGTRRWKVTHPGMVEVGDDPEAVRDALCAADVRVAVVSSVYLTDDAAERDRACTGPVLAFAVRPLSDGPSTAPLRNDDIRRRPAPWQGLNAKAKAGYLAELSDALRKVVNPRRAASFVTDDDPLVTWSSHTAARKRASESNRLVPSTEAAETFLIESHLARGAQRAGVPAVDRLVARATDDAAPRLCALLGDVGMGKTT